MSDIALPAALISIPFAFAYQIGIIEGY